MEETLDLRSVKDYMIGYYIVSKIYEIRDNFLFSEESIEYKGLVTNLKIIENIREVNFVPTKDAGILDQVAEVKKVGNLLNFEVYLDPLHLDEVTFVAPETREFKLKIQF